MRNVSYHVWVLPRPRQDRYVGGFPLYFEKRLLGFLGLDPKRARILHQFGGMGEYGIRLDLKKDLRPDVVGDAHHLPFADNTFDLVICDPPYSDELAEKLYDTPPLRFREWSSEAVRVTKPWGIICLYHLMILPRLKGTRLVSRIIILGRTYSRPRVATILQKLPEGWG